MCIRDRLILCVIACCSTDEHAWSKSAEHDAVIPETSTAHGTAQLTEQIESAVSSLREADRQASGDVEGVLASMPSRTGHGRRGWREGSHDRAPRDRSDSRRKTRSRSRGRDRNRGSSRSESPEEESKKKENTKRSKKKSKKAKKKRGRSKKKRKKKSKRKIRKRQSDARPPLRYQGDDQASGSRGKGSPDRTSFRCTWPVDHQTPVPSREAIWEQVIKRADQVGLSEPWGEEKEHVLVKLGGGDGYHVHRAFLGVSDGGGYDPDYKLEVAADTGTKTLTDPHAYFTWTLFQNGELVVALVGVTGSGTTTVSGQLGAVGRLLGDAITALLGVAPAARARPSSSANIARLAREALARQSKEALKKAGKDIENEDGEASSDGSDWREFEADLERDRAMKKEKKDRRV
eukprot:TRINITY_DN5544_c0_g1_i1.p1 TRINITY_DN5544_c0_g1~~TRINITY_DN5544_c0_g1_i1.p1  ORF type:complete len:405 (+),score=47.04 TRINITY_DN5544_c0_g1_i1:62-1276(+)